MKKILFIFTLCLVASNINAQYTRMTTLERLKGTSKFLARAAKSYTKSLLLSDKGSKREALRDYENNMLAAKFTLKKAFNNPTNVPAPRKWTNSEKIDALYTIGKGTAVVGAGAGLTYLATQPKKPALELKNLTEQTLELLAQEKNNLNQSLSPAEEKEIKSVENELKQTVKQLSEEEIEKMPELTQAQLDELGID